MAVSASKATGDESGVARRLRRRENGRFKSRGIDGMERSLAQPARPSTVPPVLDIFYILPNERSYRNRHWYTVP
jgi:hypothetical protein